MSIPGNLPNRLAAPAFCGLLLASALPLPAQQPAGQEAGPRETAEGLRAGIEKADIAAEEAGLSVRIEDDDILAMIPAARSEGELRKARSLGPKNPRVQLIEGILDFYTPAQHGGGHAEARDHFLAALELFGDDRPEPPLPAWGHANTYAWLGQALAELGRTEEARSACEKALELEPGYAWVRYALLPGLGP